MEADQAAAAAHLTANLKVAFELVEVRTGLSGMKPLLRLESPDGTGRCQAKGTREAVGVEIRGVIQACRGEKGDELRANAREMKRRLVEAVEVGGVSRVELGRFFEKYDRPVL